MCSADSLKIISDRLYNENICTIPLDEKSLSLVEKYMIIEETGSDLMRRLSNIEINYVQIHSEAEQACINASNAKHAIIKIYTGLIDAWKNSGIIHDFAFSFTENEINSIRSNFANSYEIIRANSKAISNALIVLGETSAQMRACSASFMEVYNEVKLAIYAAILNRNVENVLDCRAISLQAHASANESGRASASFLGSARQCTKLATLISSSSAEMVQALNIDEEVSHRVSISSPTKIVNLINETVQALSNISIAN